MLVCNFSLHMKKIREHGATGCNPRILCGSMSRTTIPRTLKGVGGLKLFDIPGVMYPAHMLPVDTQRRLGVVPLLSKPPSWSISARQAAEILGCLPSSARDLLHRERVRFCRVFDGTCPPRTYWDRNRVMSLARRRRPIINKKSPRLISANEAVCILSVSRNTLSRYVRAGLLQQFRLRVRGSGGARIGCFYLRSEVEKLNRHRRAILRPQLSGLQERSFYLGCSSDSALCSAAGSPTNSLVT